MLTKTSSTSNDMSKRSGAVSHLGRRYLPRGIPQSHSARSGQPSSCTLWKKLAFFLVYLTTCVAIHIIHHRNRLQPREPNEQALGGDGMVCRKRAAEDKGREGGGGRSTSLPMNAKRATGKYLTNLPWLLSHGRTNCSKRIWTYMGQIRQS